jgi:hypothetical protein
MGFGPVAGMAARKYQFQSLFPRQKQEFNGINRLEEIRGAVFYALIVIATIIVLGAIFVLIHEFIHSSVAYLRPGTWLNRIPFIQTRQGSPGSPTRYQADFACGHRHCGDPGWDRDYTQISGFNKPSKKPMSQ